MLDGADRERKFIQVLSRVVVGGGSDEGTANVVLTSRLDKR